MKAEKKSLAGNPRGRGTYNAACDVCARKKIKCDGIKPFCQPCESQGRQQECTWTKNPVRKIRSEAHFEAMHKQTETRLKQLAAFRHYADHLESLLDECHQYHPQHRSIDFRASRPSDSDGLLDVPELDYDLNDQGSDEGGDPAVMAICIPPQSLPVEPFTQPSRFPALAGDPERTYVLLVDGVESSHYNPAFDWSRHLPSIVPLDRPSHDKALDLLFKFFTSWCLRIVPALFLKDMYRALSVPPSQTPPKTPHYSPMLHNALVALALTFLDEPKFRDLRTRNCFANTAKSFIESECRKPNLSVVHALSILCSFHTSHGDQTLGYMYFGMSARMSQALGLNVDCSEWVKLGLMDEAERLDRHWANWTTFTQDVLCSLSVGRGFCVAEPIDADTRKAIAMTHIDPEFDEMPWFHLPAGNPPQPNNLTKTFEATCRLLMIARRIMGILNGLNKARSRPLVLDASISDIDVQLNIWKSSLTTELEITPRSLPTATPHKLMLHLSYWWLFILLHRPFFRKSRPIHSTDSEIDHVKLCRRAAENIMELLSTWRSLYTLRYCPIALVQTVFSAGTVYLLTAMQASSGMRIAHKELRHSLDQEALVRQYLQEIGVSWKCAMNIAGVLGNLKYDHVTPLLGRKTIPTAGPQIRDVVDEEEEEIPPTLSRSSSKSSQTRKLSSITKMKPVQPVHPRIISSGPDQSSLSTSPKHILTPPTEALPSPAQPPSITISSAHQTSSTHTASAPIAIRSQRATSSSSPSSFPDSWGLQPSSAHSASSIPSPSSSPIFSTNYTPSFVHRSSQGYPQPFSNYMDDPFSGNNDGNSEDVGGQGSFLTHDFQLSSSQPSRNHYPGGYLGMLGGQTLSETPFIGPFSEGDIQSLHFARSSQAPLGTSFINHESSSSSLGEHVPSSTHGDNDNMDLDNESWEYYFPS